MGLAFKERVNCPKCGVDVMVTGWTVDLVTTASYMRFTGRGALMIANTMRESEKASCMCCGAELGKTPGEMMEAA
jgi:hypothetical protein